MDNSNQKQPVPPVPQPPMPGQTPVQPNVVNPTPYQMPPKKKLSKGALWGIIGGSIGLIVVIIGIVLAVVFLGGPSSRDFSQAGEVLRDVITAHNDIVSDEYKLVATYGTDTSRKNAADSIKKSRDKINAKLDELGKMKGITGDKEVKEKYDALLAKREKFNKLIDLEIEVSEKFLPVVKKMSSMNSSSTVSDVSNIISELDKMDLNDTNVSNFKDVMVNYLKSIKELAEQRNSGKYDPAVYRRYSSASSKYYDAARDWQSNLEKQQKESQIKDESNALRDILNDKMLKR